MDEVTYDLRYVPLTIAVSAEDQELGRRSVAAPYDFGEFDQGV